MLSVLIWQIDSGKSASELSRVFIRLEVGGRLLMNGNFGSDSISARFEPNVSVLRVLIYHSLFSDLSDRSYIE